MGWAAVEKAGEGWVAEGTAKGCPGGGSPPLLLAAARARARAKGRARARGYERPQADWAVVEKAGAGWMEAGWTAEEKAGAGWVAKEKAAAAARSGCSMP